MHNGKGLESDFLFIKNFLAPFGENNMTFVTGAPYCYIEFGSMEQVAGLTAEFQKIEIGFHKFLNFGEKNDRFVFLFFTHRKV